MIFIQTRVIRFFPACIVQQPPLTFEPLTLAFFSFFNYLCSINVSGVDCLTLQKGYVIKAPIFQCGQRQKHSKLNLLVIPPVRLNMCV